MFVHSTFYLLRIVHVFSGPDATVKGIEQPKTEPRYFYIMLFGLLQSMYSHVLLFSLLSLLFNKLR